MNQTNRLESVSQNDHSKLNYVEVVFAAIEWEGTMIQSGGSGTLLWVVQVPLLVRWLVLVFCQSS